MRRGHEGARWRLCLLDWLVVGGKYFNVMEQ